MKSVLYMVGLVLALTLAVTNTAVATTVEFLGNFEEVWMVQSDPVIAHYDNISWEPPVKREKRDIREGAPGPSTCLFSNTQRAICWRLDGGQVDRIDWAPVKLQLATTQGCEIGSMVNCLTVGEIPVPECYRATVDVYTVYARARYRVTQGDAVALFSVLVPTSGIGIKYRELTRLDYLLCAGATPPASTRATCGSVGDRPFVGNPCQAGNNPTKRRFEDGPVLTHEPVKSATWGKIKALYDK